MGVKSWYIVVLIALLVALAGCAPRATPVPTPTPVSPQAAPAVPTPTAPALSPAEAAWQKVVYEAQKEGKFTHYGAGLTGDIGTAVATAFERKYGIKVEIVAGVGVVHLERIKTELRAGKHVADTLDTTASILILAKQDGLTVSWGDLPVLRDKNVWTVSPNVDPEGHIISYRVLAYPVMVNTNLVKAGEEPRSYRDLLDPKWRGDQITFSSPVTTPALNSIYLATKKAGTLDDDFWRRLGLKGVKVGPSLREPPSWLARGEVAISLSIADGTMAPFIKDGAPVKAIDSVEGVFVTSHGSALSLIKDGPHPNAARLFFNWFISQEGLQIYNQAVGGLSPLRKDNPDLRPAALKLGMKKPLVADFPLTLETSKIQQDLSFAKLLGLEK